MVTQAQGTSPVENMWVCLKQTFVLMESLSADPNSKNALVMV